MKNELDYLNGFDVDFLQLFYTIRITAGQIYLQGYLNKNSMKAVQKMGLLKIVDEFFEIQFVSSTELQITITLTLPTE